MVGIVLWLKSLDQGLHLTHLDFPLLLDSLVVLRAASFNDSLLFEVQLNLFFVPVPVLEVLLVVYQLTLLTSFFQLQGIHRSVSHVTTAIKHCWVRQSITLAFGLWVVLGRRNGRHFIILDDTARSHSNNLFESIGLSDRIGIHSLANVEAHNLELMVSNFICLLLSSSFELGDLAKVHSNSSTTRTFVRPKQWASLLRLGWTLWMLQTFAVWTLWLNLSLSRRLFRTMYTCQSSLGTIGILLFHYFLLLLKSSFLFNLESLVHAFDRAEKISLSILPWTVCLGPKLLELDLAKHKGLLHINFGSQKIIDLTLVLTLSLFASQTILLFLYDLLQIPSLKPPKFTKLLTVVSLLIFLVSFVVFHHVLQLRVILIYFILCGFRKVEFLIRRQWSWSHCSFRS